MIMGINPNLVAFAPFLLLDFEGPPQKKQQAAPLERRFEFVWGSAVWMLREFRPEQSCSALLQKLFARESSEQHAHEMEHACVVTN